MAPPRKYQDLPITRISQNGQKSYKCDECGKGFTSFQNAVQHFNKVHLKSICCKICKQNFGSQTLLHMHIQTKHEGIKKNGCDVCGRHFARKSTLQVRVALKIKDQEFH